MLRHTPWLLNAEEFGLNLQQMIIVLGSKGIVDQQARYL
jgi:hypothetical protein